MIVFTPNGPETVRRCDYKSDLDFYRAVLEKKCILREWGARSKKKT
jgi:hypothetical protein